MSRTEPNIKVSLEQPLNHLFHPNLTPNSQPKAAPAALNDNDALFTGGRPPVGYGSNMH